VQTLLRKEHLKRDPEVQCLEDVACLVFLEHYFADFSTQHEEEKILDIVRKTWVKMSPHGQDMARTIPMSPEVQRLVVQALAAL
jgi:hypothetical protein